MPGAGSARAAGFIAKIAPKDGTVIANIMPGAVIGPMLDPKTEKLFDPTEVQYLGNVNNGTRVCISSGHPRSRRSKTRASIKSAFGGVSTNDSTRDYGYMHRKTSGAIWNMAPATTARPTSRSRWSAARSTASAASTGRA